MSGAGIRFTEQMSGYVSFGEPDSERGAVAGRAAGNRLAVRLTIEIDDLARFSGDADRAARIVGWVDWAALGGRLPIERGVFNLLVGAEDAARREMRYRLSFRDGVGHPVTLAGEKLVGGPVFRVWADTTTLPVRLLRGWVETGDEDDAELVASGIVRLRPLDFARQLATFRATGPSPAAQVGAIARFDALFLWQLWQAYGRPAPRQAFAWLATIAAVGSLVVALRWAGGKRRQPRRTVSK